MSAAKATMVEVLRAVADHAELHHLGEDISSVRDDFVQIWTPPGQRLAQLLRWVDTLSGDVEIKAVLHAGNYQVSATGQIDSGMQMAVGNVLAADETAVVGEHLDRVEEGTLNPQVLAELVEKLAAAQAPAATS